MGILGIPKSRWCEDNWNRIYIYGPCTPTETTKQGYKFKDDKAIEITNFLII